MSNPTLSQRDAPKADRRICLNQPGRMRRYGLMFVFVYEKTERLVGVLKLKVSLLQGTEDVGNSNFPLLLSFSNSIPVFVKKKGMHIIKLMSKRVLARTYLRTSNGLKGNRAVIIEICAHILARS